MMPPIICVCTGMVSLPAVIRKVCSLGNCSMGVPVISAGESMPTVKRRTVDLPQISGRKRIVDVDDHQCLAAKMIE